MNNFNNFIERAKRNHGDKLDVSSLMSADKLARSYFDGPRLLVQTTYSDGTTYRRSGRVGVTTGWRPALLLMHRSNASGSWDMLGADDVVIAVRSGRVYIDTITRKVIPANLGYSEVKAVA